MADNNLLNFLQKQSLFNNSPTKNINRKMSSRSREKRSEHLWQGSPNNNPNQNQNFTSPQNFNGSATFTVEQNINTYTLGQNNTNTFTTNNQNSFNTGQINANQSFSTGQNVGFGQNFSTSQNFSQPQGFNSGQNITVQANIQDNNTKLKYQNPPQYGSSFQSQQQFGNVDFKVQTSIPSPTKPTLPNVQANFQTSNANSFNNFSQNIKITETITGTSGNNYNTYNSYQQQIIRHPGSLLEPTAQSYLENVVTYAVDSTNYARTEAMKRLEILSEKVRFQLNNLNSKLESFNVQMMGVVVSEFNFVKTKVYQLLEDTFRESQQYCRGYITTIQTEFNEDVLKARAALQRQNNNIQMMKIDINKPHWESNAVFVSVEFQARVNQVVNQVKNLEVKTIKQQTNQSWQMNLKRDLLDRVILRLQKERELAFGKPI